MTETTAEPGAAEPGAAEPGAAGRLTDAPITGVTVFRDGARVVRTGLTRLAAGPGSVTIGNLPVAMDTASVRVAARGHGLALLNVEVRRRVGTEPLREQTARLRAEVERWRDAVQGLADEDAAEQAGLGFLKHLSEAAATALARAVGSGRAGYDELSGMAGHLSAATAGTLARRREIAVRKRAADQELAAAEARLNAAELGGAKPRKVTFVEVAVDLEAEAATEAEIDLTYHVSGASWRSLYDLVLDGERLNVSYLAEVTQQTGENWPEVALVLSTAGQGQSQTLPELSPWYIGRQQPRPVAAAAVLRGGSMAREPASADDVAEAGSPERRVFAARAQRTPPQASMLAAEQAESESGAGLTYTVARPLAVPGDGGPHKTLVASFEAEAVLDYLTVPVIAPEAYLRATVVNGTLLLLPGRARIFHGAQFVGETHLDTVAPGEEFEVQLGVDDQIKVERKLRRRTAGKALIGGTRTIDIGYEITVENHRDRQVAVSVHDHIPVSTDGDIKVRAREAAPPPAETDDLGELIWKLALAARESAAIKHRFTVEHPAQIAVTGL